MGSTNGFAKGGASYKTAQHWNTSYICVCMCIQQIHTCIYLYTVYGCVCVCALIQYNEVFSSLFLFFTSINQSIDYWGMNEIFFNKTNTQQRKPSSSPDIHRLLSIRFDQFFWVNTLTAFTVIALPVQRSVGKKESMWQICWCSGLSPSTHILPVHTSTNQWGNIIIC